MSDILLAKPVLPEGWIDLSVGEAVVIREAFLKYFKLSLSQSSIESLLDYPPPNGTKELTSLLEAKYQAPVVVTNGAKQSLGAAFYALKKRGRTNVDMRTPFWALIPPLMAAHGITFQKSTADAQLLLLPNNPDGYMLSSREIEVVVAMCKGAGIPLIHDAVYYTHSYLPDSFPLTPFGDMQIFSASKMYGLSGLRLGYVVCHNKDYYRDLCEYMEMMTVGVSTAGQELLASILRQEKVVGKQFEFESYAALKKAKLLFKTINPDVVEVPSNFEETPGMFAWVKIKNKAALTAAKINVIDGSVFGGEGYVRMNLAVPYETLKEVVDRLKG